MTDTATRPHPSLAERWAMTQADVRLDGRPARITGYRLEHAVVRDVEGRAYEWSWITAAEIVARGGEFRS